MHFPPVCTGLSMRFWFYSLIFPRIWPTLLQGVPSFLPSWQKCEILRFVCFSRRILFLICKNKHLAKYLVKTLAKVYFTGTFLDRVLLHTSEFVIVFFGRGKVLNFFIYDKITIFEGGWCKTIKGRGYKNKQKKIRTVQFFIGGGPKLNKLWGS